MQCQVAAEYDTIQVGVDNVQVRLRRDFCLLRIYRLRQSPKEVSSFDNPRVSKDKIQPAMPLEDGLECRGQFVVDGDVDLVECGIGVQRPGDLGPSLLVDIEKMNVP